MFVAAVAVLPSVLYDSMVLKTAVEVMSEVPLINAEVVEVGEAVCVDGVGVSVDVGVGTTSDVGG